MSEIYIASKTLECAMMKKGSLETLEEVNHLDLKQTHIGYYLIDKGIDILKNRLEYKSNFVDKVSNYIFKNKSRLYIEGYFFMTLVLTMALGIVCYKFSSNNWLASVIIAIVSMIPLSEVVTQFMQYILGKVLKIYHIPKMDYLEGVPEESSTFVIIPTVIKDKEKVIEQIKNLEVYYLGNKSKNIYFALLGDASEEKTKKMDFDRWVIEAGLDEINKLNDKYKDEHGNDFPIFHFLYRTRQYNKAQNSYLGWERKRGLITEFNKYLLKKDKGTFCVNTLENNEKIPKIKYVITLDADTCLGLNSALQSIGAMSHILNAPILSKDENVVVDGYGIMQPRIALDITSSLKSKFTRIFAGYAGIDSYTNAVSDMYQDGFSEGIFTGKGIYDLETFNTILENQIPENTVLSHDLLEGSYLRCGLLTDVVYIDGYPAKYNSFCSRLHRWIRGDWQIIGWLKKSIKNNKDEDIANPLNKLSKFKINQSV